ncbi:MAG: Nudix family hydrolase [Methylovulum sp.]|nr:Nudix family hydrolase [Methylovulum sp.]
MITKKTSYAHQKPLHVAVGVVKNATDQVLISLRDDAAHQGGLWEFPGGKVEAGETAKQALVRELKEELDITVKAAMPLITIRYQYPDLAVWLEVFLVEQFTGHTKSCEGQAFKWVAANDLAHYAFPKANRPIIAAAQLPSCYAILDDADEPTLLKNLKNILAKDVKLVQARLKNLSAEATNRFIEAAYPLCQQYGSALLMNSATIPVDTLVDGIHLTSQHLLDSSQRPANCRWLAASCHNLADLQHAEKIGADFAVLAPVLATQTHPGVVGLGWQKFAELVDQVNLPVYALGGMSLNHLKTAQCTGGQGISAIRAFLD